MRPLYEDNPYAGHTAQQAPPAPKGRGPAARKNKKERPKNALFDVPLFIIVLTLVVFGLVMLYSASYAYAYYRKQDSGYYITRQLLFALAGVVVMLVASRVDYHIFQRLSLAIYLVTLVLLVVVLFMPPLNGARRWILFPGGNFQPSEVAKFAIIVMFSNLISMHYKKMKTFTYGVLSFGIIIAPVIVLMVLEPHLSGTILILSIAAVLMFVGGTSLKWFAIGGAAVASALTAVVVMFPQVIPYAQSRIYNWQHPMEDMSGDSYQTIQGLYAVGSGGAMGLGLGNSRQKHMYVPEPYNDFIFSILCEELGFVGAVIVILLFAALLFRGLYIAAKAKDRFGSMVAVGIVIQITLQAALNIAVVTNTIPNTGISLPFFSYGGTSLLMLLGEIGVLLSISRQANMEKT